MVGVLTLTFSIPTYADTRETQPSDSFNGPQYERVYSHSYTKTVTKYYNGDIPQTIDYSEYNSGFHATFSGTLTIQSVRRSNDGVYATYSGKLSGFWN